MRTPDAGTLHGSNGRRLATGAFVVLVGPDGVGKTTVARALIAACEGPTSYFHFLPPARGMMVPAPPAAVPHQGKGSPEGSRLLGWLRIARNFLRFWIGYLGAIRPALKDHHLVIGDRGMYGYIAQPHALRFYGPPALARLFVRGLPGPDLIANLSAPSDVIRARKQELTTQQIEQELGHWAGLPTRRLRTFDATNSPDVIANMILQEL
jgi:energy-coupling factor transporter ATP-binding protein EcfA2